MVKLNKEDREKRRMLILERLSQKKTILSISKELKCGASTVFRIKKAYQNYLAKLNYNTVKHNERLEKTFTTWKRNRTESTKDIYFNGFSLKEKRRKRKSTIPYKARLYIYKKCKDRNTGGVNGVSIEKIRVLTNKKFKNNKKLSFSVVARFLKKNFKRTYAIRKRPILTKKNIQKRQDFAKELLEKNIDPNTIFFTDEKKFLLNFMPNKQTNRIRLCKKSQRKIRQGNIKTIKKLEKEITKHSQGIMVAGGVCSNGIGKLKFIIGTMDTSAYKQTLDYYKEDLINLAGEKNLILQQDNAPCHVSKGSIKKLENINYLKHWPPNSPDLSPIETVWSIVQSQLEGKVIKDIDDLKNSILYVWNRIPNQYCKNICEKFLSDIKIVAKTGYRVNKRKNKRRLKFALNKTPKYSDIIEQIVYNEKSLFKIKQKSIKRIEKKNKIRNKIIKSLKRKAIKEYVKQKYRSFDEKVFNEAIEETIKNYESFYKNNEDKIIELRNKKTEDYFKELTLAQKTEIVSLNIPNKIPDDETTEEEDEKEPEEFINEIFKKHFESKKRTTRNFINEYIRIIIKANLED